MLNAIFDWVKEGFRKAAIRGIGEAIEELKGVRESPESREVKAMLDDPSETYVLEYQEPHQPGKAYVPTQEELMSWTRNDLIELCRKEGIEVKSNPTKTLLASLIIDEYRNRQ